MSADIRVWGDNQIAHYELEEKIRIHEEYLGRRIDTPTMFIYMGELGETLTLWLRARLALHARGYIPCPEM